MLEATWCDGRGRSWTLTVAESRRERARGLIGATHVAPGRGLVLLRARSVHTFGMRYAIDVVLLDRTWRVVNVVAMRPGRVLLPRRGVRHVVEVAAGSGLRPGERLRRVPRRRRVGSPSQAIQVDPVVPTTAHPSGDSSSR